MNKIYKKIAAYDIIQALSNTSYLSFTLSVLFSQLAFNMMGLVLIFLIFFLTSSNFSVSIVVLTFLLPQIFLSFIGGVMADMKNKKSILIYGNLLRAAALLILFFNTKSTILVYIVSVLVSIVTQFYVPAEAPMIPRLVRQGQLIAANSIFGMGLFGTILISYVLAGPIIHFIGRSAVFLLLSLLFLSAAIFAYFIPEADMDKVKKEDVRGMKKLSKSLLLHFKESYHLLSRAQKAGGAFFMLAFSQVVILILATIVPGYATTVLGVQAENLSLILFAPAAIGMIISALLLSIVFRGADKNLLMTIGLLISGAALILFPVASKASLPHIVRSFTFFKYAGLDQTHIASFLAFLGGAANALIFIPSQTIIQETIPEEFRSKIYGLLFSLIGVFSLIPIIVAGGIADIVGVGAVLVGVGVFILGAGAMRL